MNNKITPELKEKILKSILEDGLSVKEASEEYKVLTRTIYNWLKKDVDESGLTTKQLTEIKRFKKDKEDLLLIIGELTAELNKTKKKK